MIAALVIFASCWLNINCFRTSKLSCCEYSKWISVKLKNMADDGNLETPEDPIVTPPKIMVSRTFIFASLVIFPHRNHNSLLFDLCNREGKRSADRNL